MRTTRPSRLARLGSASAIAVLATGAVMASATAATAAKGHAKLKETTLSIKNKPIAHSHHHADAINGVLSSHHAGVAGETVTLESRTGKKPRWVVDGTATTASDGSVSFTVTPTTKTQFELRFAGDSTYRKSHSNVITLNVGHRHSK
jgi:hypothetical protein